jgi:formylglycine-generating enzyme required for sulfatase activity
LAAGLVVWVGCAAPSDLDADGVDATADCADDDPALGAVATDRDCDGVPTALDCGDDDPALGARADDGDCDGAPVVADCDDADPSFGAFVLDRDCDGILGALDCDDRATDRGASAEDGDCDGALTGSDCDDLDAFVYPGAPEACDAVDADCDGSLLDGEPDLDLDGVPDCVDPIAPGDPRPHPVLGVLRYVPAGSLMMGCVLGRDDVAGGCEDDEAPAHEVTLTTPLWMMGSEVTQAMWATWGHTDPSAWVGADRPVDRATWWEATWVANELSAADGLPPCYLHTECTGAVGEGMTCRSVAPINGCTGWRLPTEAEWEFAARADTAWPYAGGDDVLALGWVSDNAAGESQPVCSKAPNAWGLCDATGNVSEWVHDRYGPYDAAAVTDPSGPTSGVFRVFRGGGWINTVRDARLARRLYNLPGIRSDRVGFRLVRTAP